MKTDDIKRMAHDIIERCAVEDDHIEYKKSVSDVAKDGILKTACAFANNYMNREIDLERKMQKRAAAEAKAKRR